TAHFAAPVPYRGRRRRGPGIVIARVAVVGVWCCASYLADAQAQATHLMNGCLTFNKLASDRATHELGQLCLVGHAGSLIPRGLERGAQRLRRRAAPLEVWLERPSDGSVQRR